MVIVIGRKGVKYASGYETGYETGMKPFEPPRPPRLGHMLSPVGAIVL